MRKKRFIEFQTKSCAPRTSPNQRWETSGDCGRRLLRRRFLYLTETPRHYRIPNNISRYARVLLRSCELAFEWNAAFLTDQSRLLTWSTRTAPSTLSTTVGSANG